MDRGETASNIDALAGGPRPDSGLLQIKSLLVNQKGFFQLGQQDQSSRGGLVAATNSPWYRRVFRPMMVDDAKPPSPLVSRNSRWRAAQVTACLLVELNS